MTLLGITRLNSGVLPVGAPLAVGQISTVASPSAPALREICNSTRDNTPARPAVNVWAGVNCVVEISPPTDDVRTWDWSSVGAAMALEDANRAVRPTSAIQLKRIRVMRE